MMKIAWFLSLALLAASPAMARDITITLTAEEAQTVINDLDMATKSGGLQVAIGALPIVQKIQAAAQAPAPTPVERPSLAK
jgi:hypothetical protein